LSKSVADAVAYEYVGGLKEASNEDNLQLWLENELTDKVSMSISKQI